MRRAIAVLLSVLCVAPAGALKIERLPGAAGAASREVVAERLLVRFAAGANAAEKAAALASLQGTVLNELPGAGWTVVQLPAGTSVRTALDGAQNLPGVERVVPDAVLRLHAYPNDPGVPQQYSLSNTDAFAAWDYSTGLQTADGKPVTIAIIDAGVDGGGQQDVDGKLLDAVTAQAVKSQFFDPDNGGAQSNDSYPTAACNHGTQTASVAAAAANNGLGIAGVSWGARLISLRVFNAADCNADCSDKRFVGSCATSDSAMSAALNYAANVLTGVAAVGHEVANISIGGAGACATLPLTSAALANAVAKGVPVTLSTGNDGGAVNAPADCAGAGGAAAGIIPVGSSNSGNVVSSYSSNGPELAAHGVVAPGEMVFVDTISSQTTTNSGTSFSAPFVAGLAALMLAVKPTLTPAQIETFIRGGANNIGQSSSLQGAGQVNLFRAMRLAVNGTLAGSDGEQKAIAFPNPFRVAQTTVVSFSIPATLQSSSPEIKIYTVNGQLVRDLKSLAWDGKNDSGALVASGTYLIEVKTGAGHATGRFSVVR